MEKQKITGSEALLKALIAEGVDTILRLSRRTGDTYLRQFI